MHHIANSDYQLEGLGITYLTLTKTLGVAFPPFKTRKAAKDASNNGKSFVNVLDSITEIPKSWLTRSLTNLFAVVRSLFCYLYQFWILERQLRKSLPKWAILSYTVLQKSPAVYPGGKNGLLRKMPQMSMSIEVEDFLHFTQ